MSTQQQNTAPGTAGALVAIAMPLYQGARYVRAAIESVRAQTVGSWELCVVDDGSTDEGPAIVAQMASFDPRIRLVRQANRGPAAARNAALEQTRAPFVTFLDCDDLLAPGALDVLLRTMLHRADQADAALGAYTVFSEHGGTLHTHTPREEWTTLDHLLRWNAVWNCAQLVRREALGELRFRDHHKGYEDLDMWMRLAERGLRWRCTRDVVAHYRIHSSSLSKSCARMMDDGQLVARETRERLGAERFPDGLLRARLTDTAVSYSTRAACVGDVDGAVEMLARGLPAGEALGPDAAARAAYAQVMYGLGVLADCFSPGSHAWPLHVWRFWEGVAVRGLAQEGLAPLAWRELALRCVKPDAICERLLRDAEDDVTIVGMGQNGMALAARATRAGLRVRVRDDGLTDAARAPLLRTQAAGLGVTLEPMDAPTTGTVIVSPLDDASLVVRFPGARRWSEARESLCAEAAPAPGTHAA